MPNDVIATVSMSVALAQWDVSADDLSGALAEGVDGARRLDNDEWEIPTAWLDSSYVRHTVIDLRDVGSELSVVLDRLLSTRDRLSDVEIRAAKAEIEVEYLEKDVIRLEKEARRAEADAEHWLTQHDEREQDLAAEQIKTAQAVAASDELRSKLVEAESRLDGTYRELLEARSALEYSENRSVFSVLRRSRKAR